MLLFQSRLCAFPSSSDAKSRGCSQGVAQPHSEDRLIQFGFFAMGVGWGGDSNFCQVLLAFFQIEKTN